MSPDGRLSRPATRVLVASRGRERDPRRVQGEGGSSVRITVRVIHRDDRCQGPDSGEGLRWRQRKTRQAFDAKVTPFSVSAALELSLSP